RAARTSTLFPYTTLFRSVRRTHRVRVDGTSSSQVNTMRYDGAVALEEFDTASWVYAARCSSPVRTDRVGVACSNALPVSSLENRSEEHTSDLQSRENLVC